MLKSGGKHNEKAISDFCGDTRAVVARVCEALRREEHKYTWHEEADCKSMKKVPLVIHGNMSHNGGISTKNKMKKQMSEVLFDD